MDANKIDQVHATAVSLRGELLSLPERIKAVSQDDLHRYVTEKLTTLGAVVTNLVDDLRDIQQQREDAKEYN